jgi:serine/threonine protein kinase
MTWEKGQKLQGGKYVIEQILGQGGFGITYKALQVNLNRPVVIKTPNEYLNHDPEYDKYIERFIAEGRTLARLSQDPQPHIVGVIELFQEGNTHCLVMEFVPGENLFQAVKRRGALPEAEIVTYIRQIGEALMVVHQAGLVHRDAHPGNIMLRSNGKAVLIDFGISKEIVPLTGTQMSKDANAAFAPYEQIIRGTSKPTVDIYSLAATLYYGVTGQKPSVSLARKLDNDNEPLIPPQQIISSISDGLNRAILKGMALEAKDRPQSMQSWLAMLNYKHKIPNVKEKGANAVKRIVNVVGKRIPRTIPWVSLTILLLPYSLMGYILTANNAPFLLWAVAVAVVGALALIGALSGSRYWAGSWAGSWAAAVAATLALGGIFAGVLVLDRSSAGAVAEIFAWAWAWPKLEESFNKFHAFLILTGTSNIGLGLGWIVYRLFKPV